MQDEKRGAWVEVDLGALKRNAAMMAQRAGVPLLPMVKSDAYGLGVEAVVGALESLEPWGYGVATVAEGRQLRRLGIERPVLVFTPLLATELAAVHTEGLTPTFGDAERILAWHGLGGAAWHLAVDTGMSRAGVNWDRVVDVVEACRLHPPEGAFTHFHSAERDDGSMREQSERFRQAVSRMPARPRLLHAENSPAVERQSPSPWDLARPGLFLYGGGGGASVSPYPVAGLHGRIVEIRDIAAGATVSYRATWRANVPSRIATVAAGYADGVNRRLGSRGQALVRGRLAPIAGVVTMDMTMLDVTGLECAVGDVATFLGNQDGTSLSINDVAAAGDLSPYEVLVGLRLRAPRLYHQ
jgi:alanine racemase